MSRLSQTSSDGGSVSCVLALNGVRSLLPKSSKRANRYRPRSCIAEQKPLALPTR